MGSASQLLHLAAFCLLFMLASISANAKVAIPDDETPLVKMSEYKPPPVPDYASYYYPKDFRILNCWECFEAHGKICIDEDHGQMSQHTGSGDPYNGFCCKQDHNEGYCRDGYTHQNVKGQEIETVCSHNSYEDGKTRSKYKNVLSKDRRNHQMFAFCPNINQRTCGVSTQDSHDMRLKANTKKQLVYSKDMRYRDGNDSYRESDACYYEITLSDRLTSMKIKNLSADADDGDLFIRLNFTKLTEMNAYIYGGKTRKTAYENLTDGNVPAKQGVVYNISAYRGFLVVAYPNKDKDTEFAFDFWTEIVGGKKKEANQTDAAWYEFQGEFGEDVFLTLVGMACFMIFMLIVLCIVHCVLRRKLKKKEKAMKKKGIDVDGEEPEDPEGQEEDGADAASMEKSMQQVPNVLEDVNETSVRQPYNTENDANVSYDGQRQGKQRLNRGNDSSMDILDYQTEGRRQTQVKQFYSVGRGSNIVSQPKDNEEQGETEDQKSPKH